MPVLERTASKEKLAALLAEGHESEQLDYKETADLSARPGEWEMAKDIAAMEAMGGYIVVGADNTGRLTGRLSVAEMKNLDEARLRSKMRKYLTPPLDLLVGCYEMAPELRAACIYVGPNPRGWRILALPGGPRPGCPFRDGEVFVRHGTASERWDQTDLATIEERLVGRWKEEWRREFSPGVDEVDSRLPSTPSQVELDWHFDGATFSRLLLTHLRTDDSVGLLNALNELVSDASKLLASQSDDELDTALERLACFGVLSTSVERYDMTSRVADAFVRLYDRSAKLAGSPEWSAASCLRIASLVEAIGASAVRRSGWSAVRELAALPAGGEDLQQRFLLRHAVVQAGRAGLLPRAKNLNGLVSVARASIDQTPCLRPDAPAGDDAILTSLCQFDFLAVLTAMDATGSDDTRYYYTNFAAFYARRVEPIVVELIRNRPVRSVIYPRSDDELARALAVMNRLARQEAFQYGGWDGFGNNEIVEFLRQHRS